MTRSRTFVLLLALVACACASSPKHNPFKVPRETFFPMLKVVALAPVRVPADLGDPEPVRARYAELITAQLRSAGLEVVGPAQVGPILDARTNELGGIFDPHTGKLDDSKVKALYSGAMKELKARYRADALVEPSIRVVMAKLRRDTARWHGVSQDASQGLLEHALGSHTGVIPALSLYAMLWDANGELLYSKPGGIEVLVKVKVLQSGTERLRRNELFAVDERIVKSVQIAFDDLLPPATGRSEAKDAEDGSGG
jgi:hypothetical protein